MLKIYTDLAYSFVLYLALQAVSSEALPLLSGIISQGGQTLSLSDIQRKTPGPFATQLLFYALCDCNAAECVDPTSVLDDLNGAWSLHNVPIITIEWWPCGGNITNWVVQDIVLGVYDAAIRAWGNIIRTFVSSTGAGRVYVRPGHEMNGNWYPWGFQNFSATPPALYQRAFQHFTTLLRNSSNADSNSMQVIWCVNARSAHNGWIPNPDVARWYPGDSVVDWVGIDGYNTPSYVHGIWENFSFIFTSPIQNVRSFTSRPLAIPETGCDDENSTMLFASKGAWISDMTSFLLSPAPRIRMLVWFNVEKPEQGSMHFWAVASRTYENFNVPNFYQEWLVSLHIPNLWVFSDPVKYPRLISDQQFQGTA